MKKITILGLIPLVTTMGSMAEEYKKDDEKKSDSSKYWYFQGDVGLTSLSEACSQGYTSCEDISAGLAGHVGYQIKQNFALQAGYRYLGSFERSQNGAKSEASISSLEVTAVGSLPLDSLWTVYGHAGASFGQRNYSNGSVIENVSSDGVGLSPILGTGLRYRISNDWQAIAGIQWNPDVAGSTTDALVATIGFRYELEPPKAPIVHKPAPKQKEIIIEKTSLTLPALTESVYFGFNEVTLDQTAKQNMSKTIQRLIQYPESSVRLLGFADSVGNQAVNQIVSERRVRAVAKYLTEQGVDVNQITMEGFGKVDPSYSNLTAEGRAMNRRVTLITSSVVKESSD